MATKRATVSGYGMNLKRRIPMDLNIMKEIAETAVLKFASELCDSLDTQIYYAEEMRDTSMSYALRSVKDAVTSAAEELVR